MSELTLEKFEQLLQTKHKLDTQLWFPALQNALVRFDINTPQRQAAFLAQVMHESGEFMHLQEGLRYRAERLCKVWPKRFPTLEAAQPYAGNEVKLANKVYADRMGNGDEASGDGWKFRGRGLIQLTGRNNYAACMQGIEHDVVNQPDLLLQPEGACLSAAWFWSSKRVLWERKNCTLNLLADAIVEGNARKLSGLMTRAVNGGDEGLDSRWKYWQRAWSILQN